MADDTITIEAKLTVSKETAELCKTLLETYTNQTGKVVGRMRHYDGRYTYFFMDAEEEIW